MNQLRFNDVEVDEVSLRNLQTFQQRNAPGKYFLTLPKYQRGVVWSESQKKALVDSIYSGFPIGSLLAFQPSGSKEPGGSRDLIQLVDGLQRTTTVIEYLNSPLFYASPLQLFGRQGIADLSLKIVGDDNEESFSAVESALQKWMLSTKDTSQTNGFNADHLKKYLLEIEGSLIKSRSEEAEELAGDLMGHLDNIFGIIKEVQDLKVPLVVYRGPSENVPEIFERINSQGIKLSKYEKFAAGWLDVIAKIENPEIHDFINAKYQSLADRGYEIADLELDDDTLKDSYNLFEYLFGFGKLLSKDYEFLFPDSPEPDDSPSVGFVMVTIASGLKTSQMGELDKHLKGDSPEDRQKPINLKALEEALIDSCEQVSGLLRPVLKVKLNKQGTAQRFLPHSQNQIISMVIRYALEAYEFGTWKKKKQGPSKSFIENLRRHYLIDILRGKWSGSGDTRLWEMCWDGESLVDGYPSKASSHYEGEITKETFNHALDEWHEVQLQKSQKERTNISAEAKTLLRFVYSKKITVQDDDEITFDIEHLIPVGELTDLINLEASGEGWPISALGNLALLPHDINRIKGKNLLGDYLNTTSGKRRTSQELKDLKSYVLTPDIHDLKRDLVANKEAYLRFCSDRFEQQKTQIFESLRY